MFFPFIRNATYLNLIDYYFNSNFNFKIHFCLLKIAILCSSLEMVVYATDNNYDSIYFIHYKIIFK